VKVTFSVLFNVYTNKIIKECKLTVKTNSIDKEHKTELYTLDKRSGVVRSEDGVQTSADNLKKWQQYIIRKYIKQKQKQREFVAKIFKE
jgi:hypothetical protein